jgi:hypothetical protein
MTRESRFVYVTYIRTTPEKLWAALIEPEFTRQYWGNTHQVSDWKPGADWKIMIPNALRRAIALRPQGRTSRVITRVCLKVDLGNADPGFLDVIRRCIGEKHLNATEPFWPGSVTTTSQGQEECDRSSNPSHISLQ